MPLHQLIGGAKRAKIPAYASLLRIGKPELIASECEPRGSCGYKRDQAARDHDAGGVCRARGDRRRHSADGRHELPARAARRRSRSRMPAGTRRRCSSRSRSGRRRISRHWPRCASKGGLNIAAGENACTVHQFRADDEGRRGQPRAALGDQGRRHHRISEGRRARRRTRRQARAALALFRAGLAGDAAADVAARRRELTSRCST